MKLDIKFYLELLLRRLPIMAVIFTLCAGLGIALAIILPPKYTADAKLLVEGSSIPDALARSTVQTEAAEQLQIIEEKLMTRSNLIDVANRFNVFNSESKLAPDIVVRLMRETTQIHLQAGGRDSATIMSISFTSDRPDVAAGVVNELVTLVLKADTERRAAASGDTLEFFEQQVERYGSELSQRSAEIVAFKEANKDALPEGLDYRMDRQSTLQERLNLISRDRASLSDQRDRLTALGIASGASTVPLTPQQQQLAALEAELNSALSVYSENNPKVVMLRAQIEKLTERMTARPAGATGEQTTATGSVLELQLAEIDSRMKFIDQEIERTEAELLVLREAIERTPKVAIRLDELEREYDSTQNLLNSAVASRAAARSGVDIEAASKGERVRALEYAAVPESPTSPNRKLVAGGGVFAGTALASVFFALAELLNRAIRRPVDLVRGLGIQPLATIPYMEEETSRRRRRTVKTLVVLAFLIAIPVGLWLVHTYYLPLDLVVEKVIERLGL